MASDETDLDYWLRRADEESLLAERSADPAVALAHRKLAVEYRLRADALSNASDPKA